MSNENKIEVTEGAMTPDDHTAFIFRILMYLVSMEPDSILTVDLNQVLAATTGKQLKVRMEGAEFTASVVPELIIPEAAKVIH